MRFLRSPAVLVSVFVFVCVSGGAWLSAARAGAPSRVVGSDLLGAEFSRAFYAAAARAGIEVRLTFDGSRPGAQALKAGRADAALLTLPEAELAELSEFQPRPVAYHCVVVLVPQACSLRQITLAQLAAIFGARNARGVASPSSREFPSADEWAGSAIAAVVPEMGMGVTLDFFRRTVLDGGELKRDVLRYRTVEELGGHFAGESRAIALAATLPKSMRGARVLAVVARDGEAVEPEPEAVHAGKYPLRLPLAVAVRREAAVKWEPLQKWLQGEEAAAHFERAGLVALPRGRRNEEVRK